MQQEIEKLKIDRRICFYVIFALAAALIIVLYLGMSGELFYSPQTARNHISLGEDVKIYLTNDAASVCTLSFNGSSLPGDRVIQDISLYLPFEGEDCYVRAKLYIPSLGGDKIPIDIDVLPNWILSDDGYFYYDELLTKGQTVSLTTAVILPEDMMITSKKVYTIVISVETLRDELPALNIWEGMPSEVVSG